jgi:hypothetical protein
VNNIKIDVKEIEWGCMDWTGLVRIVTIGGLL